VQFLREISITLAKNMFYDKANIPECVVVEKSSAHMSRTQVMFCVHAPPRKVGRVETFIQPHLKRCVCAVLFISFACHLFSQQTYFFLLYFVTSTMGNMGEKMYLFSIFFFPLFKATIKLFCVAMQKA
jgi:hypothetical protein